MGYSYNRTAAVPRMDQNLHKPGEADEALAKSYMALVSFKQSIDEMHEIPAAIMPIYRQVMKTMDEVGEARKHTNQLREMVKRLPR